MPDDYGMELVLDLHECTPCTYDSRGKIENFLVQLCDLIGMEREDLHFWDYAGEQEAYAAAPDHLKGISAVQFIRTSSITIHTLDVLCRVYINVFSCKSFNTDAVEQFATRRFHGVCVRSTEISRS